VGCYRGMGLASALWIPPMIWIIRGHVREW
jgi:hypothetical protein